MPVFYVESSGLMKPYRTEKGTDVANALFYGRKQADVLLTSHLVTVEVESTAARGLKGKELNRISYGAILRAFADDLEAMVIVPVTASLLIEAAHAARQYALRALDSIHSQLPFVGSALHLSPWSLLRAIRIWFVPENQRVWLS